MRRFAALLTALIVLSLPLGAQAGPGTGPDNVVVATTTGANAVDERSSLRVGIYRGDDLRSANVARAESTDCTDCRTVAVAVQAVLATGNPSTVAPTNAALAINQNCLRCSTYAFAYQYVVTTDGRARLSGRARDRIEDIEDDIEDVAESGLPPAEMDARLNALAADFKATIDADLARAGEHPRGRVHKDDDTD